MPKKLAFFEDNASLWGALYYRSRYTRPVRVSVFLH